MASDLLAEVLFIFSETDCSMMTID